MLKNLQNESKTDRIIRFVFGIVLTIIGYTVFSGFVQVILYVLAFIALFTSVTGFCLIYKIFEISTIKKTL